MPNFNEFTTLNVGILIFSAAIVLILIIAFFSTSRKKRSFLKIFISCLIMNFIMLISESLVWAFEGRTNFIIPLKICLYISFISSYITIALWVLSLISFIKEKKEINTIFGTTTIAFSFIQCVLVSISAFTKIFIYVDEAGEIIYTEFYYLLTVLNLVMVILRIVFVIVYRKDLNNISKHSFVPLLVLPILSISFEWFWSITPTYLINTLATASIYFMFNLDLDKTITSKEKELEESKISIMLSQIQPHFLYNTLTSIASLCDTDPQEAKDVTIRFSNYLRNNISSLSSTEMIPFKKELEHIDCYLSIEKVRFKDRVNYDYDIQVSDFKVPPLTIQPLVENAVKHGICKKKGGGTVKISTREEDKCYVIEIVDDGVGFNTLEKKDDGRKHIGIDNVESRLSKMCSGKLEIDSKIDEGSHIKIKIPK